ncbi:MAG: carbamoyltransferase HypF [Jatrophihabitans sp.]
MPSDSIASGRERARIEVTGVVQGVGFRPFVYSLARELGLAGSVGNTAAGVVVEAEGPPQRVAEFAVRLRTDAPPLAQVDAVDVHPAAARGGTEFVISATGPADGGRTLVSPDVGTCADCLAELADPADRRYRHPFISCTNCGPRFTIITDLPYDRAATTMAELPLCDVCAAEYADPGDRRFHAQTVACHDCGPTVRLTRTAQDDVVGPDAITVARRLLGNGAVVAIKGIGGFHLACDAENESAVATLRKRKDRGDKPFAVMVASVDDASALGYVDAAEHELLTDARRPVVLLRRRADARVAASVSPDHPDIGVVLAYTPVHVLLFGLPGDAPGPRILVMTSGNLAGEPIVIDDEQARTRLDQLADAWLGHDRPIHVPCDDSVVRVAGGQVLPVRRSRGYAPLPIALPVPIDAALAVGGDLKNTFCTGDGRQAWLSAHVGDMDDLTTQQAFVAATEHLGTLTGVVPELIVCDAHPAYRSTAWARGQPLPVRTVQHHHAHIASALADNGHDGSSPVVGFAFDGTGFGQDGAIWGGEVLVADYAGFERAAHLRYVPLPGGDAGVRNPCRMALSHLHASGVEWDERLPSVAACSPMERRVLARQFETGLQCAPTSSMGRLFDAMSSLAGVCHRVAYEAEAAMRFEELARASLDSCGNAYRFDLLDGSIDARPVVAAASADVLAGVPPAIVAARFHHAVAGVVVSAACRLRDRRGLDTAALSGGVFLNVVLTELCRAGLEGAGFRVLTHRQVPPSDAGIALGQLVVGARRVERAGA